MHRNDVVRYYSPYFFSSSKIELMNALTSLSIGFGGFLVRRAHPLFVNTWKWRGIWFSTTALVGGWKIEDEAWSLLSFSNNASFALSFDRKQLSLVVCWFNSICICRPSSDSNVSMHDSLRQKKKFLNIRSCLLVVISTRSLMFWRGVWRSNESINATFIDVRNCSYSSDLPRPTPV